jgi:hypothetical protein
MTQRDDTTPQLPWYRDPYRWLLIGIPFGAFVAGLLTLVIAFHNADPELPHPDPTSSARTSQ